MPYDINKKIDQAIGMLGLQTLMILIGLVVMISWFIYWIIRG